MRRRTVLASIGVVVLAGCVTDDRTSQITVQTREREIDSPTRQIQQTGPTSETPGATPPGTESVLVEEVPAELVRYEQFGEPTLAAQGIIRNTADRALSYVEADVDFLAVSNTIVGEGFSNIIHLLAGRGWKYGIEYHSEANVPLTDVVDADVSFDLSEAFVNVNPDGLQVVESELVETVEFGEPTKAVRGTIENVGQAPLEYVEATAHFLDEEDIVVGNFFTNTESLAPGQRWRFQVEYFSESNTPVTEVVDYDLVAIT